MPLMPSSLRVPNNPSVFGQPLQPHAHNDQRPDRPAMVDLAREMLVEESQRRGWVDPDLKKPWMAKRFPSKALKRPTKPRTQGH